jgi:hypothetical protein
MAADFNRLTQSRRRAKNLCMKALAFLPLAIMLSLPAIGHAQAYGDMRNPDEYEDVNDAQLLKLAAYVLTPFGMGLEWGLARPLHYLATQSDIAPLLSGDNDRVGFGENNNADLVPPGTFDPAPMNLTNTYVPSPQDKATSESLQESTVPTPDLGHQSTVH